MSKYPNFWSVVTGSNPGFFAGYSVLAIVSAIGIIIVMATRKYRDVPHSPATWSWKYFWADNLGKFAAGFFLLPIFVRLTYEYAEPGWMILISVGLGFGFLGLSQIAENFGIWTTKSLSKKIADKLGQNPDQSQNN